MNEWKGIESRSLSELEAVKRVMKGKEGKKYDGWRECLKKEKK